MTLDDAYFYFDDLKVKYSEILRLMANQNNFDALRQLFELRWRKLRENHSIHVILDGCNSLLQFIFWAAPRNNQYLEFIDRSLDWLVDSPIFLPDEIGVNCPSGNGRTAIFAARTPRIALKLIQMGSSLDYEDPTGVSPTTHIALTNAEMLGDQALMSIFEEHFLRNSSHLFDLVFHFSVHHWHLLVKIVGRPKLFLALRELARNQHSECSRLRPLFVASGQLIRTTVMHMAFGGLEGLYLATIYKSLHLDFLLSVKDAEGRYPIDWLLEFNPINKFAALKSLFELFGPLTVAHTTKEKFTEAFTMTDAADIQCLDSIFGPCQTYFA